MKTTTCRAAGPWASAGPSVLGSSVHPRSAAGLLVGLVLTGCLSAPPPRPPVIAPPIPTEHTVTVHVCEGPCSNDEKIPAARVDAGDTFVLTDGAGNASVHLPLTDVRVCASAHGFIQACATADAGAATLDFELARDVPLTLPLHPDGKVFRTTDGAAWRWKGVSAFRLLDRFAHGEDIQPFLDAYRGFNLVRVWPYVEWGAQGWEPPSAAVTRAFLGYVGARGWYVELTALTSDESSRLAWAKDYIAQVGCTDNLVWEAGNEPTTHKAIDTAALRAVLTATGCPYSSGDYEDSSRFYGTFGTAHTARTDDFPRRAHDLLEYWLGGGPNTPDDPPHRVPWVADEPAKPADVPRATPEDWLAYFGGASLMGAGATWHCETGKYAQVPTSDEARIAALALQALNAFPAEAPLGPYRRLVEAGQPAEARTYAIGGFMVRSQQHGTTAPEAGWQPIDAGGVLWKR